MYELSSQDAGVFKASLRFVRSYCLVSICQFQLQQLPFASLKNACVCIQVLDLLRQIKRHRTQYSDLARHKEGGGDISDMDDEKEWRKVFSRMKQQRIAGAALSGLEQPLIIYEYAIQSLTRFCGIYLLGPAGQIGGTGNRHDRHQCHTCHT